MTRYNGRLQALDGSYYVICYPYSKRGRPRWLGPVNFRCICAECRDPIPRERKGLTCGAECEKTHALGKQT